MVIDHKCLNLDGKMIFEKAILKTPFTRPNPMPDEACFLFVKRGYATSYSEVANEKIYQNEGILMKCGSYLIKMLSEDEEGTYEAIAVHLYPEILNKIYQNELPSFLTSKKEIPTSPPTVKVSNDELFDKFFEGMMFYFSNPELVNEELIILKLREILLLLNNTKGSEQLHQILSSLFSTKEHSFKSIIEAHLFEDLSLNDLAVLCGQSLASFKRTFQSIFQMSPAKYIKERRLEKAASLLKNNKLSISEIAYQCAFSDLGHFSKSFRAHFNCSPSEYRTAAVF